MNGVKLAINILRDSSTYSPNTLCSKNCNSKGGTMLELVLYIGATECTTIKSQYLGF